MSCGVGHQHGSKLVLLLPLPWLWYRPAAAAPIRLLAWELPYVAGAALKKKIKLNWLLFSVSIHFHYLKYIYNDQNFLQNWVTQFPYKKRHQKNSHSRSNQQSIFSTFILSLFNTSKGKINIFGINWNYEKCGLFLLNSVEHFLNNYVAYV